MKTLIMAQSSKSLIPHGQDWLINRMKSLGYRSSDGICYGVAHMGMQAFLANDVDSFIQRLKQINEISLDSFNDEIINAKKTMVELFAKAKLESIEEKKKETGKNELSKEQIQNLYPIILEKIEEKITKHENANINNYNSIRSLLDIPAFFEEIELLHQIYLYPNLFEKGMAPSNQAALSAFEILKPQKLEKEGGAEMLDSFTGCYQLNELVIYFRNLRDMSEKASFPISIILKSSNHAIHIGYDRHTCRWFFVDANQLYTSYISVEDISVAVSQALSANGPAIFKTNIFVTKQNKEQGIKLIKECREKNDWKNIHDLTSSNIEKRVQLQDSYGYSLLYLAAQNGDLETVKLLIENGAKVNQATNDGDTPLQVAAQNGYLETVKLLIKNKADVNQAANDGITPLILAVHSGNVEMVQFLINKADVNQATNDGYTPLYVAAQNGHIGMVECLIKNKADVNQAANDGYTPLYIAAQNGHIEMVELLIKNKADVNQAKNDGVTPLLLAAYRGNVKMVECLIKNKADVNQAGTNGDTPLYLAAQNGHLEVVKLLIENKVDVNQAVTNGVTPLFLAVANDNVEMVKCLFENKENKADVNKPKDDGVTPILLAAYRGNVKMVECLIKNKADVNQAGTNGDTPLYLAAQNGHLEVVNLLIAKAENLNVPKSARSEVLIDFAAKQGRSQELIDLLKRVNSSPLFFNNNIPEKIPGFTALHAAVFYNHPEVVIALLDKGANLNQEAMGISALDFARAMKNQKMINILESHPLVCEKNKNTHF